MSRQMQFDPKRAIGVVRVSSQQQDIGASAQRTLLQQWCAREGIELVEVHEDRMSGEKTFDQRDALRAAIADCKKHKAAILIACEWDRFSRDKHFFSDLERHCAKLGVFPRTVSGGLNEAPILRDIKQVLAAEELRRIKKRNKDRAAQCKREGRLHGGSVQYGLQRKPGGKIGSRNSVVELEPNLNEQKVIETVLKLRADGCTYQDIVDRLDGANVPPRKGDWSPTKVWRIVKASKGGDVK